MAYHQLVEDQRAYYRSGATRSLEARKKNLQTLRNLLTENEKELQDAIYADLHRKSEEGKSGVHEIDELLNHLEEWSKSIKVPCPEGEEDDLWIVKEPLGVVLVIAPWNFPLYTSLHAAGAIAAGNTVILKSSELTPTFSAVITKLITKYFDKKIFAAVEGSIPEATALLQERFDHILYTGNPTVARVIMAAAAKNLTPVTLELGGKNPVVVEPDADVVETAKKIVRAKVHNCGQICISADYVLTIEEVKPKLVAALAAVFDSMTPLKQHPAFHRIVHEKHFDRLSGLLAETKGTILYKAAGDASREEKFIPPHVIGVDADDALMQQEVFGPILPIVTVKSFDEALDFVQSREKPLAAYIFTNDPNKAKRFIDVTSSGGVSVNDVMAHAMMPGVPFGGVGNSGMGRLNGKFGFDTFIHDKPVMLRKGVGRKLQSQL